MLTTILSMVLTCIILFNYVKMKTSHIVKLADKIPGPTTFSLFRQMPSSGGESKGMFENLNQLSRQYGKIFRIWKGPHLMIFLYDLKHIEIVLSDMNVLDKAWSYKYFEPWIGKGLITATGERWRSHRKIISPTFNFNNMTGFINVFNSNVAILMEKLAEHADGRTFNIYPLISLLTLDNVCETTMGVNMNAQKDDSEYTKAVYSLLDVVNMRSKKAWFQVDALFNMSSIGRLQKKCLSIVHSTATSIIKSRRQHLDCDLAEDDEGTKKGIPCLDLLIRSSRNGMCITDEDIREEVDTVMSAGHETSATTMSFICWMLATNQHVQEKAAMELKAIFGDSDRPATYNDLKNMKYLELVIKETLRVYTPVPIIGRKLSKDYDIGDYVLPAGASVMVIPYILHHNEKYYPDPEKFDPDRFLPENSLKRSPFSFLPFSAGPRNCVGQKYAILLIKTTISRILRSYKILPSNVPLRLGHKITLTSLTGINIKLNSREDS